MGRASGDPLPVPNDRSDPDRVEQDLQRREVSAGEPRSASGFSGASTRHDRRRARPASARSVRPDGVVVTPRDPRVEAVRPGWVLNGNLPYLCLARRGVRAGALPCTSLGRPFQRARDPGCTWGRPGGFAHWLPSWRESGAFPSADAAERVPLVPGACLALCEAAHLLALGRSAPSGNSPSPAFVFRGPFPAPSGGRRRICSQYRRLNSRRQAQVHPGVRGRFCVKKDTLRLFHKPRCIPASVFAKLSSTRVEGANGAPNLTSQPRRLSGKGVQSVSTVLCQTFMREL